ncbi:hypothetical protein [Brachybacterium sp.]|uniref:hypothetical protein n=1 Tax=Brachybacterium sp. TaxID=1891286 RepID=UPI002ED336D7
MTEQTLRPEPGPGFTVFPLRFTRDPKALIAFLRTLGMAPAITAGDDGFGDLVAGAGRVMVHSVQGAESGAAHGDTDLCLAVPDADRAARDLADAGIEATIWDESYGRQGRLDGPAGEGVSLNEHQSDLYGYQGHDPSAGDHRLAVTAVVMSEDFGRDAAWFARLGFVADDAADHEDAGDHEGAGDQWWRELRGPGRAGTIGLHRPVPEDRRTRPTGEEFGDCLQVRLGFSTTEALDALAERLTAAGHPARLVEGDRARSVRVTDPDGLTVEIHPRAAR